MASNRVNDFMIAISFRGPWPGARSDTPCACRSTSTTTAHINLRRTRAPTPRIPVANSIRLLGSGTLVVVLVLLVVPNTVNDSDSMLPPAFSDGKDGHPGEVHPTPLFSSQYTGSPLGTLAFCRFNQY